jgi:hypothetical protein
MAHSKKTVVFFLCLLLFSSTEGQIWKRVKDSVKHKKQFGIYAGVGGFTNLNFDAGLYYNHYKFLYTRRKAIGLEVMTWPYKAFAPKFSFHAQVFSYIHVGGQAGVFTDFISLCPFLRPEIGYSYRKFLDIRFGKNIQLPFISSELSKNMNTWQLSAVFYLRVFNKRK